VADPNNQQTQTAIARRQQDTPAGRLNTFLSDPRRLRSLAQYARNSVNPATMIRLACFAAGQDDWLAKCQPETFYTALILAAQLGLEPSGARGEAYLVPFKSRVTLLPGYRGLIKLALRSKAVRQIYAHVVYEGDEFVGSLGTDVKLHHVPALNVGEPGEAREVVAAYAVAILETGERQIEVMDRHELDRIRSFAAQGRGGKDGPAYQQWADQMMRKAPVRRLCKFLPLGDDYFIAAKLDELHDKGKPEQIRQFIDVNAADDAEPDPETGEVQQPQPSRIQQAAEKAR
jgi:recombination protein RecT